MTPYSICENVDITSGAGTDYPFGAPGCTPGFNGVRVTRSLVLCVRFCRSLFVLFFLPLCCLSFDLRILITPLVSSNSSWCRFHIYLFFFLFIYSFYCLFQNSNYCIRNTIYVLVCTCMQWWENGWNIFKQFLTISKHFYAWYIRVLNIHRSEY